MTRSEAEQVAQRYVTAQEEASGLELILLNDATIERSFGWVFFYDSKRHNETRIIRDAVAGNAPIVVTRDGSLHETGTAEPLEVYLDKFEQLNPN